MIHFICYSYFIYFFKVFNLFARTWSLHSQMVTKNIKKTNPRGKDVKKTCMALIFSSFKFAHFMLIFSYVLHYFQGLSYPKIGMSTINVELMRNFSLFGRSNIMNMWWIWILVFILIFARQISIQMQGLFCISI